MKRKIRRKKERRKEEKRTRRERTKNKKNHSVIVFMMSTRSCCHRDHGVIMIIA